MKTLTPKIIHSVPPVLSKSDRCAIDTEWFQMDKKRLHRPHGIFACATFCFNDNEVYIVTDIEDLEQAFKNIDDAVHIYVHAKFDITQLRKYIYLPPRKKLWDCMLIEQVMYSGYFTDFGLADLARRYLDVYLAKDVRDTFSEGTELTREMEEYACIDTLATYLVYKAQREGIDETDLEIWKNIELPFLWAILSMGGVKLDTEKWIALAEKNGQKAQEIQDKYGHWTELQGKRSIKKVFEGINLNSPAQVKAHLTSLGYKVKSTDVEALEEIQDDCEFAKEMLVYRNCAKRASTYGKKFVEDYVEEDGKIYADIYQVGAETGRTSYRAPNLQNQPHEFEYRDCFIAEDGNSLVVADWGSQEPRIAAYLSQDEKLIAALNGTEKLYIAIARDVLGKVITKDSEEYKSIKSTVLGIFYGMSAKGLAVRIGCSVEEAQRMIDMFLETYPSVKEYMDIQMKAKDYVQSIYGRKIWLNKYSYQWERNALNAPIQSSAADAMKIASYRFVSTHNPNFYDSSPLRLIVHDEMVAEDKENECPNIQKLLDNVMVNVAEEMHEGIKGVSEVYIGKSWACKS